MIESIRGGAVILRTVEGAYAGHAAVHGGVGHVHARAAAASGASHYLARGGGTGYAFIDHVGGRRIRDLCGGNVCGLDAVVKRAGSHGGGRKGRVHARGNIADRGIADGERSAIQRARSQRHVAGVLNGEGVYDRVPSHRERRYIGGLGQRNGRVLRRRRWRAYGVRGHHHPSGDAHAGRGSLIGDRSPVQIRLDHRMTRHAHPRTARTERSGPTGECPGCIRDREVIQSRRAGVLDGVGVLQSGAGGTVRGGTYTPCERHAGNLAHRWPDGRKPRRKDDAVGLRPEQIGEQEQRENSQFHGYLNAAIPAVPPPG